MFRKGKYLNNSVSVAIIKCFAVSAVTTRIQSLSFGLDTAPQSFCHWFITCRWYVVWSRPRNPRFRRVKSLLLLWKPHSWF